MIGFGQNVYIPDANFKSYLVGNSAINTNGDTEIQVSEATTFSGAINCSNMNIADLTGIEDFVALTYLDCYGNQLTILNVNQNTALTYLNCYTNQLTILDISVNTALTWFSCGDNQLTSLDVSTNTALTEFDCRFNQLISLDVSNNTFLTRLWCTDIQLTSLDVSNNTALTNLKCDDNQLTILDVSTNTALTYLACNDNQLTSLDVRNGNNTNFTFFKTTINPSLTCINVDNAVYSTANWTYLDAQQYFSINCEGTTSIEEHSTNKKLLKVTDLLGRETKQTNQPLFYIYDDGTVEKRIIIE